VIIHLCRLMGKNFSGRYNFWVHAYLADNDCIVGKYVDLQYEGEETSFTVTEVKDKIEVGKVLENIV